MKVAKARSLDLNVNEQGVTMLASVVVFSFAFSPLFWEYAISAEVFALNNFFISLLLWLSVEVIVDIVHGRDSFRLICIGGFISGLAFTNQHTSLLHIAYLIAVIIGVLLINQRSKVFSTVIMAGVSFVTGLSPYAYLVWAAQYHPKGSWGDTSNIYGLLRHVLRAEYGTFRLGFVEGSETAMQRIWIYLKFTNEQMHSMPLVITSCYLVYMLAKVMASAAANRAQQSTSIQQPSSTQKQRRKNKSTANNDQPVKIIEEENAIAGVTNDNLYLLLLLILFGNWLFYTITWHAIFSNLPLSSPMPFAVHARFWMQPNITLTVLLGCFFVELLLSLRFIRSLPLMFSYPVIIAVAAVLIAAHWSTMYRNDYEGWTMHRYAENIIQSPQRLAKEMNASEIILLAHTDLDWNPVRYLLTCEQNVRLEVPVYHLSLQMMPYPWFAKTQHEHFPTLEFPNTQFAGVSTDRHTEGNARLITNFLSANLRKADVVNKPKKRKESVADMKRLIFLDMQSVNEGEIGSLGSWRGYTLLPFGLQYLVLPSPPSDNATYSKIEAYYHQQSWQAIQRVHTTMPIVNESYMKKYPLGSWESAAMSVYHDAHYQLGLFYLTYAMEKPDVNMDTLPLVIDRLLAAEQLLSKAWIAASTFKTFSGAVQDLQKNTALAYMRLQAMLLVTAQVMPKYQPALEEAIVRRDHRLFLLPDLLKQMRIKSEMKQILMKAKDNMQQFVQDRPQDRDATIFVGAINKLEAKLEQL